MSLPLYVSLSTFLFSVSRAHFLSALSSSNIVFLPYPWPRSLSQILFSPISLLVSLSCHVTGSFTRQMSMLCCLNSGLSPRQRVGELMGASPSWFSSQKYLSPSLCPSFSGLSCVLNLAYSQFYCLCLFVYISVCLTFCNYLKNRQHSLSLSLSLPMILLFWVSFTNSICIALGLVYLC